MIGHPIQPLAFNISIMKTTLLFLLALVIILIDTSFLFAQPPGLPSTPSQAPIDGGLGVLMAAGGAYAVKKLRDRKKEAQEMDGVDL